MRGRNTENSIVELSSKMANYQQGRYVVMKLFHSEKHIVFNDLGKGRRKKEVYDGVKVVVAMIA